MSVELAAASAWATVSTSWPSLLLTYAAHALVWAAVAALGARCCSSFAARHRFWKAALFAPLLSAAGAGIRPAAESLLPVGLVAASSPLAVRAVPPGAPAAWPSQIELSLPSSEHEVGWFSWLALMAGGLGLVRFGASAWSLRRIVRGRTQVTDARLRSRFAALRARLALPGLLLTECDRLASPLVIGRREVCVPRGVLSCLSDEDLDAVLAHELAHLERRDGIWFPLVGAVQYTLWFQPLNHLVAGYFRSSAELACDDRAVELTRNPRALGRAILHLAEAASLRPGPALAPSMLRRESDLVARVRRLTETFAIGKLSARRRSGAAFASASVVAVAWVLFSVRVLPARRASTLAVPRQPVVALSPSAREAATLPPSFGAESARMAELAARDRQLSLLLLELSRDPAAARENTPEFTRALELGQELAHVRANQTWLEERLVAALSTSEPR